jgi:5'-nucleotidase
MTSKSISLKLGRISCLAWVTLMAADVNADPAFGRIAAAVSNEADANGEMPAGDLVADAQLMATQAANLGRAQIALVNPGALGKSGLTGRAYPHDLSYDEIMSLQPHGMVLLTMTLTAQQLKYILEQQFVGCGGQTQQNILQVSNGFSVAWKPNTTTCGKIWEVKLTHIDLSQTPPTPSGIVDFIVTAGVVLNPNKTYRVTVNDFLAKGGNHFTLLKDGTNPAEGVSDIDALASYLEPFKSPKPSYDPHSTDLNKPRIIKLTLP